MKHNDSVRLAITLFSLNAVALLVLYFIFSIGLKPADPWTAAVGVLQALLLFDTLVVVWRYTRAAEQQVEIMGVLRSDSNKPIVVTTGRKNHLSVRNIGPGVAVNVYIVVQGAPRPYQLGALGAGQELEGGVNQDYFGLKSGEQIDHLVVAEALHTRTAQWIVSLNVLKDNRVLHRMADFHRQKPTNLQVFLESHSSVLFDQLQAFERELQKGE